MLKNKKGFTLIELIVIIVIVLIAGSVLVGGCGAIRMFGGQTYEGTVNSCEKLDASYMAQGSQMFSFAVEMDVGDELITFSSEDRQFATVKVGQKLKVKVFKYPFWMFDKAGTLHSGRLLKKYKSE